MLALLFNGLAVLFAASSAPLSLSGASDTSALVQVDSSATLVLQSSSAAVALVQSDSSSTLVLLSSETATDPVQGVESATIVLASSSDTSVPANIESASPLTIAGTADAITAIISADSDAALVLSTDSSVHNNAPVIAIGGGSFFEKNRRKPKQTVEALPAIHATAAGQFVLVGESSAQTEATAGAASRLVISASSSGRRGADPMEAILFLIAA